MKIRGLEERDYYQTIAIFLFIVMLVLGHYNIKLTEENNELRKGLVETEDVSLR
jgi:hypothetical protein